MMILRDAKHDIVKSLSNFPVVGILGSRQVGKTTLAKEIQKKYPGKSIYLDIELPSDLNKLQNPELFLQQHTEDLVIIDEIQRIPELFSVLRALVDQKRVPGRFLILGSASPSLIKKASETLAGRIIYHELAPFTLSEVGYKKQNMYNLWLKGGYPESYLARSNALSLQWREAFIKTYLERDIPQLGIRIPSSQLRRFWSMVAHSHGQLWNSSQIAKSLGVSAPTVKHYLDILSDTFIVRQLQPYSLNTKKRLIKSPKVYIRDTGLLHALLNNPDLESLQSHPVAGNSWEGFVIEQIINALPEGVESYFYRTNAGAEIDMVLINGKNVTGIEIKYSATPKLSKGFWSAFEDLDCKESFVVYPGNDSYPIKKNVNVIPVPEISKIFSNKNFRQ